MFESLLKDRQFQEKCLDCARGIADWLVRTQVPPDSNQADSGHILFGIAGNGDRPWAFEWNHAFLTMGLLSAYKVFGDEKYRQAADGMIRYLKTLQIYSPFLPEHYGAIRETTPQTPWCYVRDALSGAWGFLEYYRYTRNPEYLTRTIDWAEWFLRHGMDDTPFPRWGIQFEQETDLQFPAIRNDLHGCFHGGSFNFFPRLAAISGNPKWVGDFYGKMVDYFMDTIQCSDGFFRTANIHKETDPEDPQGLLHQFNDDLGCIGLLTAYNVLGKSRCLDAVNRFMHAVIPLQRPDGSFEKSCACIPVLLNTLWEGRGLLDCSMSNDSIRAAAEAFFARQYGPDAEPDLIGAIDEFDEHGCCVRSMGYALLFFLKFAGGDYRFLGIHTGNYK